MTRKKDSEPISMGREVEHTIVTAIERAEPGTHKRAYILFLAGPLVGKLQMLEQGVSIIGRAPTNTIAINDNRVSRKHVEIHVSGDTATLVDLGSTNGTYINGERALKHTLCDGDKIQISSNTIFKYALQDHTENVFHKELYKMAVMDAVTNVYNKRFFLERLTEEISHARRNQTPLALLMIDIDFFKAVNDTHGHLAGDMVLHHVATRLKSIVRAEDLLARYGGEEFAILLRGMQEPQAQAMAERMRVAVETSPVSVDNQSIAVTISVGLAVMSIDTPYADGKALTARADDCLYASKRTGRNKVTAAGGTAE